MKRQTEIYTARLCAETVDECSQRVRDFLTELKVSKRDILRYAMTVEELLLKSADEMEDMPEIRLCMGKRFLNFFIDVEISGKACNCFLSENENNIGVLGSGILKNLGLAPEYQYADGSNRYRLVIKRKRVNPFIPLVTAMALAALIGSLGFFLSAPAREQLLNSFLLPINNAFLDLLGCIAGPMIFLSVAWGIYGIGDAATLKHIGKKLCGSFIGTMAAVPSILCLLLLPMFDLCFSNASTDGSALSSVFVMLLGIIPKDLFSPFVNGNTLQIIFLAVAVGIAMLFLGQKTDFVAKIVEQINFIVQFLIEAICRLVPGFLFIVLLKLIWSDMLRSLSGIGKLLAAFLGSALLATLIIIIYTALKNKVNPARLIKKGMPTLLIALSTASSAAAFGNNMNAARKEYGIDEKLCSFGIPLGVVTFKPTSALNYMAQCLFFAEVYRVDVSVSWIVIMMLMSIVLAIATPPIPGGGMATYAVLFAQLGIPTEALAIALACETVFDFVVTGFDQFGISFVLLNMAGKLGFVDREKLLK